jgi:hypothetical protein
MQANVTAFLSWVSGEALNTPEPIVLLVLGGIYLMLSFRVCARTKAAAPRRSVAPVRPVPRPSSALVTQQGR